jgi:hypothetical protein
MRLSSGFLTNPYHLLDTPFLLTRLIDRPGAS